MRNDNKLLWMLGVCEHVSHLFSLQNQSRWKAMSEEALKSVCAPGSTASLPPLPPLCAPSLDPAEVSNHLELEMRFLVSEHRKVKLSGEHGAVA